MPALFVQQLTVIDFSYLHKTRGVLGESWIVDIELHGDLDEQGMVFDFGHVKKQIKQVIDNSVDHAFVIPKGLQNLSIEQRGEQIYLDWFNPPLVLQYHSPADALFFLDSKEVTLLEMERVLEKIILSEVPNNVSKVKVTLREENISGSYYHYTHGLKKHLGDCQRIAHGHRSKIEILQEGIRSTEREAEWASRFKDIYLATKEDLVEELEVEGVACFRFAYEAQQGTFSITLPVSSCYLIDTDSTVEWIAHHIAKTLQSEFPDSQFTVRAFEGVQKGAIAYTPV